MGDDGSQYGVFIIESMDIDNEKDNKLDGLALKTMLDLCSIPNEYFYIRTKLEFEHVIQRFEDSNLRFLHIACHGNEEELVFTYESVKFAELARLIDDRLHKRRLFLSACQVAVFELAEHFIPKVNAFSVIGTPDDIDYDKAALFWSTFYYLMYSNDFSQMIQVDILPTLKRVSELFTVSLNYFSIITDINPVSLDHLKEFHISNGKVIREEIKKTQFINQFRDPNFPFNPDNIIYEGS